MFSSGTLTLEFKSSDAYIIVIWTILLCAIIALVLVGILAMKMKRELQTYNVLAIGAHLRITKITRRKVEICVPFVTTIL